MMVLSLNQFLIIPFHKLIRIGKLFLLIFSYSISSFSQQNNFFTYLGGEYADGIDTTSDRGYIVSGRTGYNPNGSNFIITKLDSAGVIQWQYINNQFNGSDGDNYISKVIEDIDKGYLCIGGIDNMGPPYGNNSLIVKLDSLGSLVWNKQFDLNEGEGFGTIDINSDSTYIVTGGTGSINGIFNVILNINNLGDSLWMKKIIPDSGYFFQITNLFTRPSNTYLYGNYYDQTSGKVTKAIHTLDNSFNLINRNILSDTSVLLTLVDNYISDTVILTYNKFITSNNIVYSKIDKYSFTGNRISSVINPLIFGSFQSDSTIVGFTGPNSFGIGNFLNNNSRTYTSYNFSVFNQIKFDHSKTDRNKNSLWCGRADIGFGDMAYVARFADTVQLRITELIKPIESPLLYPIPTHDILNVKLPKEFKNSNSELIGIEVFDCSGRLVLERIIKYLNIFSVDVGSCISGIYLLKITSANQTFTSKFIIN